jgi:hypothetical protein
MRHAEKTSPETTMGCDSITNKNSDVPETEDVKF